LVGRYQAIVGGGDGSVIGLERVPRHGKDRLTARITQIAPGGKPDTSFGVQGIATVQFAPGDAGGVLDSLAIDGRGRILAAGMLETSKGVLMVLVRLSARGRQQMGFGPHGRVVTRIQGLAEPTTLLVDQHGGVVAVHIYENAFKGRSGLVVARYAVHN
jgi:hypothetical protein